MDDKTLIARLKYQGAQYENGQVARGGKRELHILTQAAERLEVVRNALNDLLNDCINFDGGKLTDCIMESASRALKPIKD